MSDYLNRKPKKKDPLRPSESQIQQTVFDWIARNVGRHPGLALAHHVPNVRQEEIKRMRLGLEGAVAGVPDIVVPAAHGGWHGLYLELKTDRGKLTENQDWWLSQLNSQGYLAAVAYNVDQAIGLIEWYMSKPATLPLPYVQGMELTARALVDENGIEEGFPEWLMRQHG